MSDHTPSTDEVGEAYIQMRVRESGASTPDERILASVDALPEWERWLAAHDATVRADHERGVRERIAQDIVRELGEGRAADIVRKGA